MFWYRQCRLIPLWSSTTRTREELGGGKGVGGGDGGGGGGVGVRLGGLT